MLLRRWALRGAVAGGASYATYSFFKPVQNDVDFTGSKKKRRITRFNSLVDRGDDLRVMKTRAQQVAMLKSGEPFDVLFVGGGCTGSGAALDAATRGLKTACIERGDFSNETSSRSSKLIWGGFKYLQVAFSELLSTKTLSNPVGSFSKFWSEFSMVVECCQERSWLAGMQSHLVRYVPQAVPFSDWFMWPAPFNHPFYSILPVIALPAFLFYDGLASFNAPLSYAMGPRKAKEAFPQLADDLFYSAVYCEAMHNDARTGTAIALTASQHGATIANYVEMIGLIKDKDGVAIGAKCVDKVTGEEFEVRATAVVFATGAFLDPVRRMDDPAAEKAVAAAAGVHIVLPGYFTPAGMGLCNLRTKRGATMYFLPWQGHTIVGSTDKKCDATSSPAVTEDEIQYLVNEAASCLSHDIRVRRSDVLSAWQGWRPLYRDPKAPPGAPVSRHHAIGMDPTSKIIFICGGKWSTYRAMAEELVDRVIKEREFGRIKNLGPCVTKGIKLLGGDGYHDLLYVQLVQKYGVSEAVARHLTHTYGAAAFAVCEHKSKKAIKNKTLVDGYPFIEAEVEYAANNEYAVTVKDMLTLRMRLAYLNSEAAKHAIPRVAELMGDALGWSSRERKRQIEEAKKYIGEFGGPLANKKNARLKAQTYTDLLDSAPESTANSLRPHSSPSVAPPRADRFVAAVVPPTSQCSTRSTRTPTVTLTRTSSSVRRRSSASRSRTRVSSRRPLRRLTRMATAASPRASSSSGGTRARWTASRRSCTCS